MPAARLRHIAAVATACAILAVPAFAETMTFKADMTAAAEVPPTDSQAAGTAEVTVDTDAKTVSWVLTTDKLTGEATAAHIHGPAGPTENAPPIVPFDEIMKGSATVTEDVIKAIQDGKAYVNVHTEKFPSGEIRGQLMKAE